MRQGIYTVYWPSPLADDGEVRAAATLEVSGEEVHVHTSGVWLGEKCIGCICGMSHTDAAEPHRGKALEAIAGLRALLENEYGLAPVPEREADIVPPSTEEEGQA